MTSESTPEVVVVGSVNTDVRIRVDVLPRPGETVLGSDPETLPGGKGANQAVALARLGRRVALVAAVGDDKDGEWLRDRLRGEGVDVTHLVTVPGPTGRAHVFVTPSGENSIVVSPGANASMSRELVQSAASLLGTAAVTLAQCEIPVDAVTETARLAGGRFVLNPAPAVALNEEIWARTDVLVPNTPELARLAGVDGADEGTPTLSRLAAGLPCPRVVVTLGSAGALVVEPEAVLSIAAPLVTAVDTTGAGDCFCAALADGLVDGLELRDATARAVRAGALSVQRRGAQDSAPTRAELEALTLT